MPTVTCVYMGFRRTPSACEIYRVNMPLHFLGQNKHWQVQWLFSGDLVAEYATRKINTWKRVVEQSDLLIFPRTYAQDQNTLELFHLFFEAIHRAGKKIVYEVDDDYTNEHRAVIHGDAISIAQHADAITVTTPLLGDLMTERTKRPHHILPNMLDPTLWAKGNIERPEKGVGKVYIALSGSATHYNDWKVLADIFPPLMEKYPQAHLILTGFHPDYLSDVPNVTRIPGLPYPTYASMVRQCDIVLAPVDPDDGFNLAKSPIKAVEGMGARRLVNGKAAGAAVIATNNPVYQLSIRHEDTGLLVAHTPHAWQDAIETLIADEPLRHRLQYNGYRHVWKHLDISKHWTLWAKAYRSILSAR